MPDVTGYVAIKNNFDTAIQDVELSVVVDGTPAPVLRESSLPQGLVSLNRKYRFPNGSAMQWRIAFTLNGTNMTGTATCQLSSADINQTLKIGLSADGVTLSPRAGEKVTGLYDKVSGAEG